MAEYLDVVGIEKLNAAGRLLRAAPKELRRELYRELNGATKQVRQELRDAIPEALPRRGGLAERARQRASITATVKTGASSSAASIKVKGRKGGPDVGRIIERGLVRHPVFGTDRAATGVRGKNAKRAASRGQWAWVDQSAGVDQLALRRAFERYRPEATRVLFRALDHLAVKVAASINKAG